MKTRTKILIGLGFFVIGVWGISSLVTNYVRHDFLESQEYKVALGFALRNDSIQLQSGGIIRIREETAGGIWKGDSVRIVFTVIGKKQNLVISCFMTKEPDNSFRIYKTKFFPESKLKFNR